MNSVHPFQHTLEHRTQPHTNRCGCPDFHLYPLGFQARNDMENLQQFVENTTQQVQ